MSDDWEYDGWCGGHEVHMEEGRMTQVLGPDGDPVRYNARHKCGFDLRPARRQPIRGFASRRKPGTDL